MLYNLNNELSLRDGENHYLFLCCERERTSLKEYKSTSITKLVNLYSLIEDFPCTLKILALRMKWDC